MTRAPQGEKHSRRGFDEKAYLSSKVLQAGEDPYRQHAFNQLESDKLSSDRPIRDTRHYRYPPAPALREPAAPQRRSAMLAKDILGVSVPPMVHCFTEFHGSSGKFSNARRTLTNSVPARDVSNISFSRSKHHLVLAQPLPPQLGLLIGQLSFAQLLPHSQLPSAFFCPVCKVHLCCSLALLCCSSPAVLWLFEAGLVLFSSLNITG